jgi:hypothetical protein
MNDIHISPIAVVCNSRLTEDNDHWGDLVSEIVLVLTLPANGSLP